MMASLEVILKDPIGNLIVSTLMAGFFASFVASLIFFYLQKKIIPKIKFSENIAFIKKNGEDDFYQIKYKNAGKRGIIHLEMEVKLVCNYNIPDGKVNSTVNLPLRRSYLVLLDTYNKKKSTGHFTITFYLTDKKFINTIINENKRENILPPFIVDKLSTFDVTLDHLLDWYDEIRCYVVATDPLSGTTTIFKKYYKRSNITRGIFKARSLTIQESSYPDLVMRATKTEVLSKKLR